MQEPANRKVQNKREHRCARLLSFFPLRDSDRAIAVSAVSLSPRSGSSEAHRRVDAAVLIVERSVDLVLVLNKHVVTRHRLARGPRKRGADGNVLLQVAAAMPVSGVGNGARAVIHRGLRIGA